MKNQIRLLALGIIIVISFYESSGQDYLKPLGYEGNTLGYLKVERRSKIYDSKSRKVLKEFDFDIDIAKHLSNDSILFYYKYDKKNSVSLNNSFSSKDKIYGRYNINSGNDSGFKFRNLTQRKINIICKKEISGIKSKMINH